MPGIGPRSSHMRRRSGVQRRKLVWATNSQVAQALATTPQSYDLLSNLRVAGSSVPGATVMRVHIDFSSVWQAVTTAQGIAIGLAVEDTDIIGTNAFSPGASGRDWMLRQNWFPGGGLNSTGPVATPTEGFRIDVRSKRKVQELNQSLGLVLQSVTATTPPTVSFFARVLIALP